MLQRQMTNHTKLAETKKTLHQTVTTAKKRKTTFVYSPNVIEYLQNVTSESIGGKETNEIIT